MENELFRFTTRISVPLELESHCVKHSIKAHRRTFQFWAVCVVILFSVNLIAGVVNLSLESNDVSTYLINTEYYE